MKTMSAPPPWGWQIDEFRMTSFGSRIGFLHAFGEV